MTYVWSLLCYIHLITFCISIFAPIAIINASPYIIFSYIVDTILIQHEVKALIKEYSIDE